MANSDGMRLGVYARACEDVRGARGSRDARRPSESGSTVTVLGDAARRCCRRPAAPRPPAALRPPCGASGPTCRRRSSSVVCTSTRQHAVRRPRATARGRRSRRTPAARRRGGRRVRPRAPRACRRPARAPARRGRSRRTVDGRLVARVRLVISPSIRKVMRTSVASSSPVPSSSDSVSVAMSGSPRPRPGESARGHDAASLVAHDDAQLPTRRATARTSIGPSPSG